MQKRKIAIIAVLVAIVPGIIVMTTMITSSLEITNIHLVANVMIVRMTAAIAAVHLDAIGMSEMAWAEINRLLIRVMMMGMIAGVAIVHLDTMLMTRMIEIVGIERLMQVVLQQITTRTNHM